MDLDKMFARPVSSFSEQEITEARAHIRRNYEQILHDARISKTDDEYKAFGFAMWLILNTPTNAELLEQQAGKLPYAPLISVIIPVYNVKEQYLTELLDSIYVQTYANFEICVADGASGNPRLREIIKTYKQKYGKLKYIFLNKNKGISENTNAAIALSCGEYLAFVDHDDMILPNALYETAKAVNENTDAGLFFTDSLLLYDDGRLTYTIKPGWNHSIFLISNYIVHLVTARRDLVIGAGMFNKEYDEYQDTDLFFKLTEITRAVHIPEPLYIWRRHDTSVSSRLDNLPPPPYVITAKTEHLARMGAEDRSPRVSLIIELPDDTAAAHALVSDTLRNAGYSNIEVIILYSRHYSADTRKYISGLRKNSIFKIHPYQGDTPPSPAQYFNRAAEAADGDFLIFINKDIKIHTADFIQQYNWPWTVGYYKYAAAGCAVSVTDKNGESLYDSGIEYIGCNADIDTYYLPVQNGAEKAFLKEVKYEYFDCTSVVKGCVMINKKIFDELSGFDARLPEHFYLSDFCVRAAEAGYWNTVLSGIKISRPVSEPSDGFYSELALFKERWRGRLMKSDPALSPHISVTNYIKYDCPLDFS